ncbi:hypothetical protein [Chamaesiphon sp. VAR_48_metabat_135_sub]|uniref:hypothetical protein n=1 Tax=Chamaesiphon sp. VAR_48_metabat_135_sub TaxID=2964699 RepID=UPI00286C3916|nr:hypothetical protein [Chamaesiphon sp. VAR_48_metabat_135_sub]
MVATLTALANQTHLSGKPLNPLTYEIIILANNCSDDSATIARQFAQQHPELVLHIAEVTLPPDLAYIGQRRKMKPFIKPYYGWMRGFAIAPWCR